MGLLNVDGYYDSLLGFFDKGVEEGFIGPSARNIVISARTATELIQKMEVQTCTSHLICYRLYAGSLALTLRLMCSL